MSKKKSATTMTLKDFHGGSIPSDLPLPSAPGVSVKPSQERPTAMSARSERTRHISTSPAAISPLPAPRVIGRHFDEDERTPFNAPPRITGAMPAATGAWAQRKEQSNPAAGSGTGVTTWSPSRVAQARAFEKVISGRWHSNSKSELVPPVSESEIRPTGDIGFGSGDSHASRFGMDERAVPCIISSENRIRSPVEQNQVLSGPGYKFDVDVPDQTGTVISSYGNAHFSGIRSVQRQAQHTLSVGENHVMAVTDEPQVQRLGLVSEFNLPEQTHASGSSFEKPCYHGPGLESKQRPVARTGVIGDHRVRPPAGAVDMPGAKSEHARHISASPAAISPHPVPPRVTVQYFDDDDESLPCDALPRETAATPMVTGAWAQRREQSNSAACSTLAGSGAGVTTWSHSRISQAKAFEKVMSGQWHSNSRSDHLILPVDESENRSVGDTGFGSGDSYTSRFRMDERAIPYGSVLSENRIRSPVEQNHVFSGHSYGFDVNVPDQTGTVASGYGNVHISGIRSDQKQVHRTGVIGENHIRAVADELQVKGPGTISEMDLRDQTRPSSEESYRHVSSLERQIARTGVIGDNLVRSPTGSPEIRRVGSGSGTWSEEMYGFGTNKRQYYNNWEQRPRSVGLVERKDKTGLGIGSEMKEIERPASHGGVSVARPTAQKEGTDRPRLKLLPRTKPIESQEIRVPEDKVGSELHSCTNVPVGNDLHEMDESVVWPNERPRLNLKPRSQAIGRQPGEAGGKERPSVFGNARPRELVLMERGVDLASDDIYKNVPSNRPSSSSEKTESKTEPVPTKPVNRPENYQLQQRNIQNFNTNQKEHHQHHAKHQHHPDTQRSTWRDDTHNSTNNRKTQHQQKPRPEPDSWRKPEPVKQEDISSPRPGKGATALELAVAFSRRSTISNGNRDSVSTNPNAVVFSRLLLGR